MSSDPASDGGLVRNLADYDARFGVDFDPGTPAAGPGTRTGEAV